ncbi:hypothetical protein AVEN_204658-1, partial [Araneus ventricosus]
RWKKFKDTLGPFAGRYGCPDARGIGRQVHYVADHAGLRARVHAMEQEVVHSTQSLLESSPTPGLLTWSVSSSTYVDPFMDMTTDENGYGLGYNRHGLGYGYSGLRDGYGCSGYAGFLGSYGVVSTFKDILPRRIGLSYLENRIINMFLAIEEPFFLFSI